MAKVVFLGTAGAVACAERDNTSLLIITGREKLLVDCPGSITAKLNKVGTDYRRIKHILLTHAHPDHIYGIVSFLHSLFSMKKEVKIYAARGTIERVEALRNLFKLKEEEGFPKVIYCGLSENLRKPFYSSEQLSVFSFKTKHKPESVGFKFVFKKEGRICIFSGDTAATRKILEVAKTCDYLIHDCFCPSYYFRKYPQMGSMHTSSLDLGNLASRAKVKTLVPIHFAQEFTFSLDALLGEIKQGFKGRIIIPEDFYTLRLRPRDGLAPN
jgi:ribonuclease BN (tRNA processing enzyme)